jgi:Uma2 family endonuclease
MLAPSIEAGQIVMNDVSWEYYDRTLREIEEKHLRIRVTFDNGRMELMTQGGQHEYAKTMIGRLLELYALERDIPITGLGSVTCRREDLQKGVEADECYYVRNTPPPGDMLEFDLTVYAPPDLAIEVEITRGVLPRLPIYAALGVAEVWKYSAKGIVPLLRQPDGAYKSSEPSLAFPELQLPSFARFIEMALSQSQHEAVLAFRDWLRGSA